MQLGTYLDRIKHRLEKWGRGAGSIEIQYEDVRALVACTEALRKHEPNHIALKWLDTRSVVID